jgi:uncharacterized protein (TIGR03435 family)
MIVPEFWKEAWTAALVNHLWQSTVVVLIAWLLALILRNNHARMRYWVWMIASVKFLVPFSLLIAAGEGLRRQLAAPFQRPVLAAVMEQITQPFPQTFTQTAQTNLANLSQSTAATSHHGSLLPLILLSLWLCGFLAVVFSWFRGWRQIRASVRASSRMNMLAELPVLSSPRLLEPGVFGIIRPVLLLPEGIGDRLNPEQLGAILAHEFCHLRRRDNLTAAIHMAVEAFFWFHPAVWWIQARLLEERERACDEAVLQSGNESVIYAESILNVCKFYVESPLACVSGVTGSDLKRRIVRIMEEQMGKKLDLSRKILLGLAAIVALAVPITFGLVHSNPVSAQAISAQDVAGDWQGTLHVGKDLRIVFRITKAEGGGYKAVSYSIDQGGAVIPVDKFSLDGTTVKMTITTVGGSFDGKLSADGKTIVGNLTQGAAMPLTLTRATPETAWAIPEPPPVIPPMAANANPSFEVATIKPSKPDQQGKVLTVQGRKMVVVNQTLKDLVGFAYGLHSTQILGLPAWAESDHYDITAQPDGEGMPNAAQLKKMLQKLIVERYKLTFHHEQKQLSVYVLSVAKSGPKLPKSTSDPKGLPGIGFRQLGAMVAVNASMNDLCVLGLQGVVLDRPVLDQTGIDGKFDFQLNWTPDDSQFAFFNVKVPAPSDTANAPPNLYTAIQEQLGLKLDATKAAADVLVIDHVEKPSQN